MTLPVALQHGGASPTAPGTHGRSKSRTCGLHICAVVLCVSAADSTTAAHSGLTFSDDCAEQQRLYQAGLVGDVVWPGFYIICVEAAATTASMNEVSATDFVFSDGSRLPGPPAGSDTEALTAYLEGSVLSHLGAQGLRSDDPTQGDPTIVRSRFDWSQYRLGSKLFTTDGQPVDSAEGLTTLSTVYLFEGGQFLWPGFHIGFERNITVPNGLADGPITLQTLSLRPLAFRVKHFLSGAECKHIVKLSKKHLQPSMVVQQASDNSEEQGTSAAHQSRTSSNTGLSRGATATVLRIERRAHEISRLPYELGEQLQVVKYDQGQKYEAHRDFFHSNDYYGNPQMLDMVDCGARNRLSTLFWYLNTVPEGGETYFPRALNASGVEYNRWNYNYADCYLGLAVKPRQGSGVLFYSMLPNSELDERSLHGGCPPRGESKSKWGANQWTYNKMDTPNNGQCGPRISGHRSDL
eukprot:m.420139 g.420139  ORF g.420139 m.420139 type:complete len:466 (-) comp32232_c0_seq1:149-1546(-)